MNKIKPQVLSAILALFLIGVLVIWLSPEHIGDIGTGVITGIGMLAMKVIEDSKDE